MYRYIILFTLPEHADKHLRNIMDTISEHTFTPPPYTKLPPHITFHKPLRGIRESTLCNVTEKMASSMKRTPISFGRIAHFGKEYIVLPVHTTLEIAHHWIGVSIQFSQLPDYEEDVHEEKNSLHVTLAKKTSKTFDAAWPHIKDIAFDIEFLLDAVEIWREPIHGIGYEKFKRYELQK